MGRIAIVTALAADTLVFGEEEGKTPGLDLTTMPPSFGELPSPGEGRWCTPW